MAHVKEMLSTEDMQKYKKDLITWDLLKRLHRNQQAELLLHYEKSFKMTEIAEVLAINVQRLHTLKWSLKKEGYIAEDGKSLADPAAKAEQENKVIETKKKKKVAAASKKEKKSTKNQPNKKEDPIDPDPIQPSEELIATIQEIPIQEIPQIMQPEQMNLYNPAGDGVRVSLDEFMKILQIQQRMADMMQEASQAKASSGLRFKINGEYHAADLTKRLNKILLMIEDEPSKYAVQFEIVEIEAETDQNDPSAQHHQLIEEVNELQQKLQEMQSQIEQQKQLENFIAKSYKLNGNDQAAAGLHNPPSEFKKAPPSGIIEKENTNFYQVFYICDCGHKAKHYVDLGSIYVNCNSCGKRMRKREAVKDEYLKQDSFGNYFVAGKFKRSDEMDRDRSLYEVWNA